MNKISEDNQTLGETPQPISNTRHILAGLGSAVAAEKTHQLGSLGYMAAAGNGHADINDAAQMRKSDALGRWFRRRGSYVTPERPIDALGVKTLNVNSKPGAAGYNMFTDTAYLGRGVHPGLWGHEAGHAAGSRKLLWSQQVGKTGFGLGNLYALLGTKDKDKADKAALISSGLFAAGVLPSEIDASRRGFSMMRKLPFSQRLKSFVGLPTYLGMTALPFLGVKIKDMMGGFNPRVEKQASSTSTGRLKLASAFIKVSMKLPSGVGRLTGKDWGKWLGYTDKEWAKFSPQLPGKSIVKPGERAMSMEDMLAKFKLHMQGQEDNVRHFTENIPD